MMDSIRNFCRNLIKYFIYIAVFAQIVSGTVYLVCNFANYVIYPETEEMMHVARGLLFDEYTGVLYPLLIRVCLNIQTGFGFGYYLIVYLLQFFLFFVSAYYLVKAFFQGKKAWIVTAFIMSFPMCLQCILMVSPFALKAGFSFFVVGAMVRLWNHPCKIGTWIVFFLSYVLTALNTTDDVYLWIVPIAIFAIAVFFRKKNELSIVKRICILVTVVLVFAATLGIMNHTIEAGARGRMQRTVSSVLFQRTLWPDFRMKFAFLPMDVLSQIDSALAVESDGAAETIVYKIGPILDRAYGLRRANELYMESFFNQMDYNKTAIFKSVFHDFVGYLLVPYSTIRYMTGQDGSAFATLYGIMSTGNPGMTYLYFCIAFVSVFVLTFKGVLSSIKRRYHHQKSHSKAIVLLTGLLVYQALWYSVANVQGVDYRYGLFNVAVFSLFIFKGELFETSKDESKKRTLQFSKKHLYIGGVIALCLMMTGLGLLVTKNDYKKSDLLAGREIVCFGDSIWGLVDDETGIAALVEEMTGATVNNYAVPGTTASEAEYTGKKMGIEDYTLVKMIEHTEYLENADYVMIAYGLNDYFQGVSIESEQYNDVTTYKGALCYAVEYIKQRYPDVQIVLIGQTYCQFYSYGVVEKDSDTCDLGGGVGMDYVNAVEEVADKYNLIFINPYEELPIHKWNGTLYLEDATHLNESGRREYAKVVSDNLLDDFKERNAR